MKKTTKKTKKVVEIPVEVIKEQISALSLSFGTEDMNKVVEKINEIIASINKVL